MQHNIPANERGLAIYSFFAKRQPRSYLGKIMVVAFLGTHTPLLTLFFYAIATTTLPYETKTRILIVALIATLIGTGVTLFTLHKLLAPITLTFLSLRRYLAEQIKPQLPTHFTDEAGILMADTMYAIGKLDETIETLTHYDALTALPNRTLFQAQLAQQLQQAAQHHSPVAVMMLDLDNFAALNNNLGQQQGDLLLRQAAQRLAATVQEGGGISRLEGDAFALLYANYSSLQEVITQANKVLAAVNKPFVLADREHFLTASIGIATDNTGEEEAAGLLTKADTALRVAKERSRNSIQFFATAMNEELQRRLDLERDMRSALETEGFSLYYQPQVDLSTGAITGAEALLRWFHPQKGLISPAEVIPIAEASGLILPLGAWVLQEACRQNVRWQRAGLPPIRVAVNLSAAQFQQADLIESVADVLASSHLAPDALELEITESLLMADVDRATTTLQQLCALGTPIALDDFGTGYSSLSYLKRFPLHYLKIDRSFVNGLPNDSNDAAIVRAIVALAQSLQLAVIAEGVETKEQANYLQQIGCSTFQGFYFSRAIAATEFATLLEQHEQQPRSRCAHNGESHHRTFLYQQQQRSPQKI